MRGRLPKRFQDPTWAVNNMLKKPICAILVFAITLVTVTAPKVSAQSPAGDLAQPASLLSKADLPAQPAIPGSDLKKSFAAEVAKIKAGSLTEAGLGRIAKEHQDQQSGVPVEPKWTRKKKILVALFIVVAAGALVVAYKHRCRDQPDKPCPEFDSTDY